MTAGRDLSTTATALRDGAARRRCVPRRHRPVGRAGDRPRGAALARSAQRRHGQGLRRRPGAVLGQRHSTCRIHVKASFWLHQPDEVVLRHLVGLNHRPVPAPGTGGRPDRCHTTRAAPTRDPDATEVLPRIAANPDEPSTEPLQTLAVPTPPRHPGGAPQAGRPNPDHDRDAAGRDRHQLAVTAVIGDGELGYPPGALYDRLIARRAPVPRPCRCRNPSARSLSWLRSWRRAVQHVAGVAGSGWRRSPLDLATHRVPLDAWCARKRRSLPYRPGSARRWPCVTDPILPTESALGRGPELVPVQTWTMHLVTLRGGCESGRQQGLPLSIGSPDLVSVDRSQLRS